MRHVKVRGVLHLLSAVKYIGDGTLVYMPGKVDTKALRDYRLLEVPRERMGLNFMYIHVHGRQRRSTAAHGSYKHSKKRLKP